MNEQAKLLLSAYRPHGQDAGDPAFAEAIAATQEDATLKQWFADQQAFDRQISSKLSEVTAPPGLRERILAGAKVSRPARWWQLPQLWAVAAAITLLAVITAFILPPRSSIPGWQMNAIAVLEDLEGGRTGFNQSGNDATKLAAWLKEQSAPTPDGFPAKLASTPTYGCKTWTWEGRPISLVCFNAGNRRGVHLFTTDLAGLTEVPPAGKPIFTRHGSWFLASWSQGDKAHMLVGEEGRDMLQQLISHHAESPQALALIPSWF